MRALVTGASGFVGRWLTRHLAVRGDDVVAVDREEADLGDADALDRLVRDASPDAVVHLAAQSSVARSFAEPVETFEVNLLGTVRLLEAVRRNAPGARFVLASSAEVYGAAAPEDLPLRESAPLRPASPYAASKAAAELATLQSHRAFGLHAVVARSFNAIGPGQSPTFALPSFAAQIATIARGEAEPIIRVGNLGAERDFTDVRDVARAYALLVDRGEPGGVYNICSGEAISLHRALEMLIETSGVDVEVRVDPDRLRPNDIPRLVGDSSRLQGDTGWRREVALTRSLADVLGEQG